MKTITLKLSGMSCQGCANTLKVALSRVSGVRRADVGVSGWSKPDRPVIERHSGCREGRGLRGVGL